MIATCKTDPHTTSDCGQLWSKDVQQFFLVCLEARAHMLIQTLTLGRSDVQSFTSRVYSHTTWQWDAVGFWLLYQQLVLSLGLLVSWSLLRSFRLPSSPSCWFRSVVQVWLQLLKFIWVLPNNSWSWGVLHWELWHEDLQARQRSDMIKSSLASEEPSTAWGKPNQFLPELVQGRSRHELRKPYTGWKNAGNMWFPFKFPQNQNRGSW